MAKNKKNSTGTPVRLGATVKAFTLCLVLGALAIGFVWQKRQIYSLGVKTAELEKKLANLKRDNETRRQQMAMLHSLPYLDSRVKELKLGLGIPTPDQVLTLVEGQVVRTVPRSTPAAPASVSAMAFPTDKTYFAYATKPVPPPSRKR